MISRAGRFPLRLLWQHCSPDLPLIEALGPQILATFSFSTKRLTMHLNVVMLVFLAAALAAASLAIFFQATRCVGVCGDGVDAAACFLRAKQPCFFFSPWLLCRACAAVSPGVEMHAKEYDLARGRLPSCSLGGGVVSPLPLLVLKGWLPALSPSTPLYFMPHGEG